MKGNFVLRGPRRAQVSQSLTMTNGRARALMLNGPQGKGLRGSQSPGCASPMLPSLRQVFPPCLSWQVTPQPRLPVSSQDRARHFLRQPVSPVGSLMVGKLFFILIGNLLGPVVAPVQLWEPERSAFVHLFIHWTSIRSTSHRLGSVLQGWATWEG